MLLSKANLISIHTLTSACSLILTSHDSIEQLDKAENIGEGKFFLENSSEGSFPSIN